MEFFLTLSAVTMWAYFTIKIYVVLSNMEKLKNMEDYGQKLTDLIEQEKKRIKEKK